MPTAELHQYFDGERAAGFLAVALGLASLGAAFYVWSIRSPFKAAAWPLIGIGLIELGVGATLVARTPSQVRVLEAGLECAPAQTASAESHRMQRVNRSFRAIMAAEMVLIAAGACLAFFLRSSNLGWSAVGMALLLEAAVLLVFDLIAEHRAHAYARWLSTL